MEREHAPHASDADRELWSTLAELAHLQDTGVLDAEGYEFHRRRILARAAAAREAPAAAAVAPLPTRASASAHPSRPWRPSPPAVMAAAAISAAILASAYAVVRVQSGDGSSPPSAFAPATPPPGDDAPGPGMPVSLPAANPVVGTPGAPIGWMPESNAVVVVTPISAGVDVNLVKPGERYWVRIVTPATLDALRVDATLTVTTDHAGNRVGVACQTPDRSRGATFSVDASRTWRVSIDESGAATVVDSGQTNVIHPPGVPNTLSAVCITSGSSLTLMYAINGTLVADVTGQAITQQGWDPWLYLCSCNGTERVDARQVHVGSVSSGAAVGRIRPRTVAVLGRRV